MDQRIVIETPRLYVRTWKSDDFAALYAVMSSHQTHLFTNEQPWSQEATHAMIEWHIQHRIGWEPGTFNCPLILRANESLIGRVGLNPYLPEEHIPEIEWTINAEHWGKGYATEIGHAMLKYGFRAAQFPTIMGFAHVQNLASRRVMEKIGMRYLYEKVEEGHLLSFYRIDS
jgi:[ribosomal protein S5]-alanine N-acetyltransferase